MQTNFIYLFDIDLGKKCITVNTENCDNICLFF